VEVNAERTPVPECNACQTISSVPERLPTPWFKRGLPQQPQASDSTDAKFSNSLVRPVYLLRLLGMLRLTIRVFALTPTGLGTDCIYNGFSLLCGT
jgi:hypothetical protein